PGGAVLRGLRLAHARDRRRGPCVAGGHVRAHRSGTPAHGAQRRVEACVRADRVGPDDQRLRTDGMGVTAFPTVHVAAIQATPVVLDAEGCVDKAERLLHEAADRGAQLAVLPECFIPLYPSNAWARGAAGFGGWDELWERLWA